jgi:hypothetical protein
LRRTGVILLERHSGQQHLANAGDGDLTVVRETQRDRSEWDTDQSLDFALADSGDHFKQLGLANAVGTVDDHERPVDGEEDLVVESPEKLLYARCDELWQGDLFVVGDAVGFGKPTGRRDRAQTRRGVGVKRPPAFERCAPERDERNR